VIGELILRKHIINKKLLVLLFICIGIRIIPAFAVDSSVSEAYQKIDSAFTKRSDLELNTILKNERKNENYDFIEAYTMKRIRRLIIASEFKFAEQAVLVVIDNNLENTAAVEMYTAIEDSLKKQEAYEKQQQDLKLAEQARFEKEKEAQRAKANKEFQVAKTASGDSVYITGRDEKYSEVYWNARFGLADLMFISETPDDYSSLRYGLAAAFTWEYSLQKKFVFGLDADAEAIILALYNDDKTMTGSVKIAPKISFAGFNKNIFLRAGFAGIITAAAGSETVLHENFLTPLVGVGFNHVKIGNINLSGFYDYYIGHLFYEDVNSAMGAGLNAALPITELEKIRLNFNTGINDNLYIKSNGIENRVGITFAIGVENVSN
jgi:hypothetical protein